MKKGDGSWLLSRFLHHPNPFSEQAYLLLCLFFLSLFLRLCVAILWPFFFLPFGIILNFIDVYIVISCLLNQSCNLSLHLFDEALCRLEGWEVVGSNNECGVLGDVSCGLLGSVLDDETSKTAEIDILLVLEQTAFYFLHEGFNDSRDLFLSYASLVCNLVYYICFCHCCK